MPLFKGTVQLANEQWVRNLQTGVNDLTPTAPKLTNNEEHRKEMEIIRMRGQLATQVMSQQAAEWRARYIDEQIQHNRTFAPPSAQILNQRKTPRLTIQEINRMTKPQLINALGVNKPTTMEDQRGAFMKFLDLIDLPRNTIFNVAFTDKGSADDVIAGGGLMTGAGAAIGAVVGALATLPAGGIGAIPGAMKGAAVGATVYGGTLGATSAIGTLLDEEDKRQIRINSTEAGDMAAGGRPRVFFSEVLDRLGMEESFKRTALGFIGDVLLDPLSYVTGGGQVVKWGAKGTGSALSRTGVKTVETRGIAYIKDFAKEAAKKGKFVKDPKTGVTKLVLPENSPYKQLEDFYNNTLLVGDDALADIGAGMDRGKRLSEAMQAVEKAQAGGKISWGEMRALQAKVLEATRDELIFFENFIDIGELATRAGKGAVGHVDKDLIGLGEMSRDIFRRFLAKSSFQTHLPFMDWLHPLYRRKLGYRNILTNIPIFRFDRVGTKYKALGKTDEAFRIRENLRQAEMAKDIAGNLGEFKGVNLFLSTGTRKGAVLGKHLATLKESMPEALRNKIQFTRTESAVDTTFLPADVRKRIPTGGQTYGVRVEVTDLRASEVEYLKKRGFQFEYDIADKIFDEKKLMENLKYDEQLREIRFTQEAVALKDEYIQQTEAVNLAKAKLQTAQEEQTTLQGMLELGRPEEALKGATPEEKDLIKYVNGLVDSAKKELTQAIARKDLTVDQINQIISRPTSTILDAANDVRGAEFLGNSLAFYEGPGFLGRLMHSYNKTTHDMQLRLNQATNEKNLFVNQIEKAKRQIADGSHDPEFRAQFAQQLAKVAQLSDEKEALVAGTAISIRAGDTAQEFRKAGFLKTEEEVSAAASFMDSMYKNRKSADSALSEDEWFDKYFQVEKGGVPGSLGDEVFFHTSATVDTPTGKKSIITFKHIVDENAPHLDWKNARSSFDNISESRIENNWIKEGVAETVKVKRGASLAHTKDGSLQGNMSVELVTDMNDTELEYWANVHALSNNSTEASIFEVTETGTANLFEFKTNDNQAAADFLKKFIEDNNLSENGAFTSNFTYQILDDGTVRVMTKGIVNKPDQMRKMLKSSDFDIESTINQLAGEAHVEKTKGIWSKVGEGSKKNSVQERKEALFWKAKELEGRADFRPSKRHTGNDKEGPSLLGSIGEDGKIRHEGKFEDFRSVRVLKSFSSNENLIEKIPGETIRANARTGKEWRDYLLGRGIDKNTEYPPDWNYKTVDGDGNVVNAPMNREEMKWLGIDDFLKFNEDKPITANEILRQSELEHFDIQLIERGTDPNTGRPIQVGPDDPINKRDLKLVETHIETTKERILSKVPERFAPRTRRELANDYREWLNRQASATSKGGGPTKGWNKLKKLLDDGRFEKFKDTIFGDPSRFIKPKKITGLDTSDFPTGGSQLPNYIKYDMDYLKGDELRAEIDALGLSSDEAADVFADMYSLYRLKRRARALKETGKYEPKWGEYTDTQKGLIGFKQGNTNYREFILRPGMSNVSPGWHGADGSRGIHGDELSTHWYESHANYGGHIRTTDDYIINENGELERWLVVQEVQHDLDNATRRLDNSMWFRMFDELNLHGKIGDAPANPRTFKKFVLEELAQNEEYGPEIVEFFNALADSGGFVSRDLAKLLYKSREALKKAKFDFIEDDWLLERSAKMQGIGTETDNYYNKIMIKKVMENLLTNNGKGTNVSQHRGITFSEDFAQQYSGIRLANPQNVDQSTAGKGKWLQRFVNSARNEYGQGVDWSDKIKWRVVASKNSIDDFHVEIEYVDPNGRTHSSSNHFYMKDEIENGGAMQNTYQQMIVNSDTGGQIDYAMGGFQRSLDVMYARNADGVSAVDRFKTGDKGKFESEWVSLKTPTQNGGIGTAYKKGGQISNALEEIGNELQPRFFVEEVNSFGINTESASDLARIYKPIHGDQVAMGDFSFINDYEIETAVLKREIDQSISEFKESLLQSGLWSQSDIDDFDGLMPNEFYQAVTDSAHNRMSADRRNFLFDESGFDMPELRNIAVKNRELDSVGFEFSQKHGFNPSDFSETEMLVAKQFNEELINSGVELREVTVGSKTGRVPKDATKYIEVVQRVLKILPEGERQKFLNRLGFGADPKHLTSSVGVRFTDLSNPLIQQTKYGGVNTLFHTAEGTRRASVEFSASGNAVVRALDSPDVTSFVHEMGHILRRTMGEEELVLLAKALKVDDINIWSVEAEEKFANAFMDYIFHGKGRAPSPELEDAFERMRNVVGEVYEKNYDSPIQGKLRRGLERAFGGTPESAKKAMRYRKVKKQLVTEERKAGRMRAIVEDAETQISELSDKVNLANEEYDKVIQPLRDELQARKSSLANRAATVLEKYDRTVRNVTGVGRRGSFAGEAVQRLRHGAENVSGMYQNMVIKEFDGKVKEFTKKYDMETEDAHAILLAKVVEQETDVYGRTGFHPSDTIINPTSSGSIDNIMEKYGGRDRIWNDTTLTNMAKKISQMHRDYGLKEASMGALETADPSFAYVPLSLTDEAQRAAWAKQSLERSVRAGTSDVGLTQASSKHRSTNRHWYPTERAEDAFWVDPETGQGWNFVFSAEFDGRKLPAEYEAYRLAYLRENPDQMLPGDIYDYNQRLKAAGASDQEIPGGRARGARWMPEATPTSPYELNKPEIRDRFNHVVGTEYGDALWQTDLVAVLGARTQQHHRIQAFDDFHRNILPDLKVLRTEDIHDYITNPRGGMSATSVGGEVIINDVPYRRLDESIRDNRTLKALFGKDAGNMWYPEDVASALDDYVRRISDDKNLTAIGNIFDYVQSIWKGSVLMNPAWTTVNVLGGIIHSVVVGELNAADFIRHYPTARKIANDFHFGNKAGGVIPYGSGFVFDDAKKVLVGGDEMSEVDAATHLVSVNAIDGSQAAREMMMAHRTAFGNKNPHSKNGVMDIVRNIATFGPIGAWWFKLNSSIDDTFRTTVYLARRAKGDTADQAALMMKKAHFDYGDFTRYEETIGRRVMPFYAWQRNNIALQSKLLFEKPGYVNAWQKIKHAVEEEGLNEEDKVPNYMSPRWIKNQLMIQLSGNDGKTKGLAIGNLTPINELLEIGQGLYGQEGFADMVNYFISSSSPLIKAPFEMAIGRQLFDGRAIGDPEMGELSLTDYMLQQVGYYQSWKGLEKAATRDGLEGVFWRLIVRGRMQPFDVERFQAQLSIEKNEDIKLLRRSINKAIQQGDDERAERIAERIIDEYRVMWFSGLRNRVPKELWGRFHQETAQYHSEGLNVPGANIPIQPKIR